MPKKPSDATLVRQLRSKVRILEQQLVAARDQTSQYRARATQAETAAADWRTRFDILLRRDPQPGSASESQS